MSDHLTDILAFSVIVYLVVRSNLNKILTPRLFNYSPRRNVLFPVHIHFTFRARDVSVIRKRKAIIIPFCHRSMACLDLYSLESIYSLPGG